MLFQTDEKSSKKWPKIFSVNGPSNAVPKWCNGKQTNKHEVAHVNGPSNAVPNW